MRLRARATRTKRERESKQTHTLSVWVFDLVGYAREVMGYEPTEGQARILRDVGETYRAQFERRDYLAGTLAADKLTVWAPGQEIRNWFRIESGHGFGKTKVVATIVNHAFDCLPSVVGYTIATDWQALEDKLWKEIIGDRQGKNLPGRILAGKLRLTRGAKHWIQARATSNAKGKGKDRIHGVHAPYWCFAVDEADAVEPYAFDAIKSNTTGGIGVVILIGNPRRRSSRFYKLRTDSRVRNYRFSSLDHPNVRQGYEVIPGGGITRGWVVDMVVGHCSVAGWVPPETVAAGDEAVERYGRNFDRGDDHTFAASWYTVDRPDGTAGVPVLRPDDEFLYQVLGIPPTGSTTNTLISYGRVENARHAGAEGPLSADGVSHAFDLPLLFGMVPGSPDDLARVTLGVDVARYGLDKGTVYVRFRGRVWRWAQISGQDEDAYIAAIRNAVAFCRAVSLRPIPSPGKPAPVVRPLERVDVRIDNGGGWATALIRALKTSGELEELAPTWVVVEFLSNSRAVGKAEDGVTDATEKYDDLVTQLYAEAGEALSDLRLGGPGFDAPDTLDADLCERKFRFRLRGSRERRKLEDKDDYRTEHGRSPDDGDGAALALGRDSLFVGQRTHRLGSAARPKRARAAGRR